MFEENRIINLYSTDKKTTNYPVKRSSMLETKMTENEDISLCSENNENTDQFRRIAVKSELKDDKCKNVSVSNLIKDDNRKIYDKERPIRKTINNWIYFINDYDNDFVKNAKKQLDFYKNEKNYNKNMKIKSIMDHEIKRKISNYKMQDYKKKIFNEEKFISFDFIKNKLIESELACFYCKKNIYIIYQDVRDPYQWSVDRINNENGHNNDNIIISCLKCNLHRRCRKSDEFDFTLNMKIIKV